MSNKIDFDKEFKDIDLYCYETEQKALLNIANAWHDFQSGQEFLDYCHNKFSDDRIDKYLILCGCNITELPKLEESTINDLSQSVIDLKKSTFDILINRLHDAYTDFESCSIQKNRQLEELSISQSTELANLENLQASKLNDLQKTHAEKLSELRKSQGEPTTPLKIKIKLSESSISHNKRMLKIVEQELTQKIRSGIYIPLIASVIITVAICITIGIDKWWIILGFIFIITWRANSNISYDMESRTDLKKRIQRSQNNIYQSVKQLPELEQLEAANAIEFESLKEELNCEFESLKETLSREIQLKKEDLQNILQSQNIECKKEIDYKRKELLKKLSSVLCFFEILDKKIQKTIFDTLIKVNIQSCNRILESHAILNGLPKIIEEESRSIDISSQQITYSWDDARWWGKHIKNNYIPRITGLAAMFIRAGKLVLLKEQKSQFFFNMVAWGREQHVRQLITEKVIDLKIDQLPLLLNCRISNQGQSSGHIAIFTNSPETRQAATAAIESIALRAIATFPVRKLQGIFIDPVSMGNTFPFKSLPEEIRGKRTYTTSDDI